MNIYKCLNEITKYIDEHLEDKIDYDILAKFIGVNTYTMQRIFSLIAGITLSEYIRKRRLSQAGFDLYNKKTKIIDVALKYKYENATSFSRAFESFHNIKPSKVTNTTKLKNYPRIVFNEDVKVACEFEYEITERDEMKLYGIGTKTDNDHIKIDAPAFFNKISEQFENTYGEIKYAMVTYRSDNREIVNGYYVLYEDNHNGLEEVIIPKSKWLIFKINSQEAKDIQEISNKFYLEFLPSCKFNLREIPELEYYHDDITEFLVPIY